MGMIVPFISLVFSLNCITNWPIFTPCWPSAGPTGGAGVAWPPGHWSLTFAVITFAIVHTLPVFMGWAWHGPPEFTTGWRATPTLLGPIFSDQPRNFVEIR